MIDSRPASYLDTALRAVYPQDFDCRLQARGRFEAASVPSPDGLAGLAVDLAGMTRSLSPPVAARKILFMYADHGADDQGQIAPPTGTAGQRAEAILQGRLPVCSLARRAGAEIRLVDAGSRDDGPAAAAGGLILVKRIGRGTADITLGPAMSRTHAVLAVEAGIGIAAQLAVGTDLFALSGLGSGGRLASMAIAAICAGRTAAEAAEGGAGEAALASVLERNRPDGGDGLDLLSKVGGFEIGALAGLIIGAAGRRLPILIDGLTAAAGAAVALRLEPMVRDYLLWVVPGGCSASTALLEAVRSRPLLTVMPDMGEGIGAILALSLVEAAAELLAAAPADSGRAPRRPQGGG